VEEEPLTHLVCEKGRLIRNRKRELERSLILDSFKKDLGLPQDLNFGVSSEVYESATDLELFGPVRRPGEVGRGDALILRILEGFHDELGQTVERICRKDRLAAPFSAITDHPRTLSEHGQLHQIGTVMSTMKFKQFIADVQASTAWFVPEGLEISSTESPVCMLPACQTLTMKAYERLFLSIDVKTNTFSSWNWRHMSDDKFFWFSESTARISRSVQEGSKRGEIKN
jgi:hypothetical protein